jgi:hypothetical protein
MIADKNTRHVEGNMTGDAVRMGIAEGAEAHIMSILTDLYEDPEAAIVREYSTNAYDAHVEAGVTKPIEVTTPTQLSPFLKIRDHGCGLTVDDIHSIYSQYGASTKRGTNTQVGMLGLGCKSALTYADQFTLTSAKDGTKVVVVVGRDEDGAGTMTVVDTRATDESDGTEVMIPAKRHNAIEEKAAKFFSYWPEGSVLLNGKPPKRFEGLHLTDNLYIVEDEADQSYVVMGNVAYPADIDLGDVRNVSLVAFVPIGAVNFPPARESLMDTAKTREALAKIAKEFHASVDGVIQREVDKAETPADAIRTIVKWSRYVSSASTSTNDYTYKGQKIPQSYTPAPQPVLDSAGRQKFSDPDVQGNCVALMKDTPLNTMTRYSYRHGSYGSWNTSVRQGSIPVSDWPRTLWLKNFVPAKMTKQHRDKLMKFCEQKGIDVSEATKIVGDPTTGPVSDFINPEWVFDWTLVRAIQLQPRATSTGRPARLPGSYDCYVNGERKIGLDGAAIDLTAPLFWVNNNYHGGRRYSEALNEFYPKFTLVCLPSNRVAKFCRLNPNAKTATEGVQDAADKWAATLSDEDKAVLALHDHDNGETDKLRKLDPARVDDPAVKYGCKIAKLNSDRLVRARAKFERILDTKRIVRDSKWSNPLAPYPLVLHYYTYAGRGLPPHDHCYLYMNAAYAAAQAEAA